MTTSQHVHLPSDYYKSQAGTWKQANDLLGGTKAMRAATTEYLPKNEDESDKHYKARLNRSFLFSVFGQTVKTMAGKPFFEPVSVEASEKLVSYTDDINMQGESLTSFCNDCLKHVLAKGITYILVDHPTKPKNDDGIEIQLSKQDENDLGIRPYWTHVHAKNLLDFDVEVIGGRTVLTCIRIMESVTEVDKEDQFKKIEVQQVRVIKRGEYFIWREMQNKKDTWELIDQGTRSIDQITIVPIYAEKTGFMKGETPLQPLLEKNIEHYQSSSDQRNILHIARVPLLFMKMIEQQLDPQTKLPTGKLKTGSIISGQDPSADMKYVEISGAGSITAGQKDLEALVDEMEAMGGQIMLTKQLGPKTATEDQNDEVKNNSVLHGIIASMESALQQAFAYTALYIGEDQNQDIQVTLFKDFLITTSGYASFEKLVEAVAMKFISRETAYDICNEHNLLTGRNIDLDEEFERLENEVSNELLISPFQNDESEVGDGTADPDAIG